MSAENPWPRCKPHFEDAIYEDLSWLGLTWERPVRRQSDHFPDYEKALGALRDRNVVYRCFKTRKDVLDDIARAPHLAPAGPEGPAYAGAALDPAEERALLTQGTPYAWRLSMAAARERLGTAFEALTFSEQTDNGMQRVQATPKIFGDPVIARKDNGTSYHLASVIDDALQGVTHVIRGEDLRPAAHLHRLLQALLDLPGPVYQHHRLITDETGKRFAKRDKAATLRQLRESGATPQSIEEKLGLSAPAGRKR
ncbi:MAG: tRNA glutamyl-Q(34) synthetase GluQRS [Pseudomonadota bacterium]